VSDYLPKFKPGEAFTLTATGTITGGQLVTVAGAVAAADSSPGSASPARRVVRQQSASTPTACSGSPPPARWRPGSSVKCAAAGQVTTWVSGTDNYDRSSASPSRPPPAPVPSSPSAWPAEESPDAHHVPPAPRPRSTGRPSPPTG
jgi:hypothetical protein